MILLKEIDYKIRDVFGNKPSPYYFEYRDCFAKASVVFSSNDLENVIGYTPILEIDTFEDSHIIHHDFRKLNSILYSLKNKGYDCQAFKCEGGWKIYQKVNDWTPLIGEKDFWISPCNNFYIRRHLLTDGRKTPITVFDIRAMGIDSNEVGFCSDELKDVLEEYYKPELHIQLLHFTKDCNRYKDKLIEYLK